MSPLPRFAKVHPFVFLVSVYILIKIVSLCIMVSLPGFKVDVTDYGVYWIWASNILHGLIPYQDFHVDYPLLFWVPVTIATAASGFLSSPEAFTAAFRVMMVACDLVVLYCVYRIATHVHGSVQAGLLAGILYSAAFSTTYFLLWKYDAYPLALLMLALLFTIEGERWKGYLAAIVGFFTKMFPVVSLPFLLSYPKNSSLQEKFSIIAILLVGIFGGALLFPGTLTTFSHGAGDRGQWLYAPTLAYAVSVLAGITPDPVAVSYILLGVCAAAGISLILIYRRWVRKTPGTLVAAVTVAVLLAILSSTHYSTQFSLWLAPLLAILYARSIIGWLIFAIYETVHYTIYPCLWDVAYINESYLGDTISVAWLFLLVWVAMILMVALEAEAYFRGKEGHLI